jgi:hypothetical protein
MSNYTPTNSTKTPVTWTSIGLAVSSTYGVIMFLGQLLEWAN